MSLDLLGTPKTVSRSRRFNQYLPWILAACTTTYLLSASVRHPECLPNPLGHEQSAPIVDTHKPPEAAVASHASYHRKGLPAWKNVESLFCFGDSYTSTGFDVEGEQPRLGHPLGNHGKSPLSMNWPTFLTSTHNASFLRTYNFAAGGSTIDRDIVTPYLLGRSFVEETADFLKHYATAPVKADWNPATTIFSIWFGINDLILPRFQNLDSPSVALISDIYYNTVVKLYDAGARNFLFFTVPPAYRSLELDFEKLLSVAEDIASFNSRIFEMKSNLQQEYPQANFAAFDAHSFWARVIENPTDFDETKHIKNSTAVCSNIQQERKRPINSVCQDGKPLREHLWTDLHGTYSIHNATAARIARDCFGSNGKQGFCF